MGGGGGAVLVLSELESMAARQQREIAQQRRLLEQREARLAVLRGTQVGLVVRPRRHLIVFLSSLPPLSLSFWFTLAAARAGGRGNARSYAYGNKPDAVVTVIYLSRLSSLIDRISIISGKAVD